ncbi:protease, partial [Streptomyces nanshensis]
AVGAARAAEAAAAAGIHWRTCPESEELPSTVECGRVTVPLDYAEPGGRKIRLAVSRKRATGPAAQRRGPLLHNPGGPGVDGMNFPLYGTTRGGVWKKLNRAYDFVGHAPRGTGRSAPLLCRDPAEADRGPSRSPRVPSEAYKRRMREEAAAFARACAHEHRGRLGHFTTADNARDLDVLRAALHRRRTDFVGTSWGSYLGAVYATLFPDRVRHLVLDGVVDPRPGRIWYRNALAQNESFQRRWRDFTSWTAAHHSVYGLGRSAEAVQRTFDRARDTFDGHGVGGWAGRRAGSRQLLRSYHDAGYSDESWPRLAAALAEFHEGDPRPLAGLAAPGPRAAAQEENSDSVYSAVQCSEGHWPRDWSRWDRDNTTTARRAPFQTWENVRANLPCAYWKGRRSRPVDVRAAPGELPPVLLLASTRDAATPYGGAVETWKRLPSASLVTEKGAGTHGVAGGNDCADRHLAAYLLHDRAPGRAADCPARPAPRPLPRDASSK